MLKSTYIASPPCRRGLFAAVALIAAVLSPRLMAAEKFDPYDLLRLKTVIDAVISPDGKHVAYVLNVPRNPLKEKDGPAYTQLHVVTADGASRPYIAGKVNIRGIAWTPGGERISFLAKRSDDKNTSLYAIPLVGGEAERLLNHGTSISSYSWSPDGKQVAFLATAPESKEDKELKAKGFSQQIYEEDGREVRVWIADIPVKENAKPRMLDLKGSASELHWSPAGGKIAVALAPTPLIDAHYMFRIVHVVDVKSGKVTAKLDHSAKLGQVAWSPDGKLLATISAENINDPREGRIFVWTADGKKRRIAFLNLLGHISSIAWNDESKIAYIAGVGVWTRMGVLDLNGKAVPESAGENSPVFSNLTVSRDGKNAAAIGQTPRHPGEVFVFQLGEPKRLTHSNPWLKEKRFARQEVVKYKARDGLELEGILVHPLDEKPGQRYPLILTVHGGPESHVPNGWVTRYVYAGQIGAAQGFAVFYPNYRGSTGRGVQFSKMGQEDAAGKEFDDYVDAVDHLVEMGLVDKKKVGITGGSYGGYASAWGATFYSDRFAASVMFVGISNNVSKVGTTDIPYEMYHVHHRKWLWEDWDYFLKRSPIYYVEKAHTPLLILHGKEDPRVHPGQSMELYRHLKVRGKAPVRLVFYPGEGHGNRRAASRLDYNLRLMRWMNHFLKGSGGEAPPYKLKYEPRKSAARE